MAVEFKNHKDAVDFFEQMRKPTFEAVEGLSSTVGYAVNPKIKRRLSASYLRLYGYTDSGKYYETYDGEDVCLTVLDNQGGLVDRD